MGFAASSLMPLSNSEVEESLSGSSPSTFNRGLAIVLSVHSLSKIQPPSVERKPMPSGRTRWLTQEEWLRLRKALEAESPLLRQAAEFTLATGLRENNVLGLEWSQVDLKRRVAWLHGDQMKGKVPLGVPLNDSACAVLRSRMGIHKRWVFGNPDYVLSKASNRAWYTALRRAKLVGFRWHDLRHTWASWHVMSGTSLAELQELGGWRSHQMVRRYAHFSASHLSDAANRLKPQSVNKK